MKKKQYIIAAILLTLNLTGCRTTHQTETQIGLTKKQQGELLVSLAEYPADVQTLFAKTTIVLDYNGHSATLKGRLRMRRNEVVQMTITALGLMEIAAIEFTPQGAYVIDKVNKHYACIDYASGWMNLAGVNFNTVQSLFWNRLFIPGEKESWRHVGDFLFTNIGTQCLVEPNRQRMLKCQFYTTPDCKQLQQTDLQLQQYKVVWRYEQFGTIDSYACPAVHDVSVSGNTHTVGARIGLSSMTALDAGWRGSTDFSRYEEVGLKQLMSILNMIR